MIGRVTLLFSQIWKQHFAIIGGMNAQGFVGISSSNTRRKCVFNLFWTLMRRNVLGTIKAITSAHFAAWLKNFTAREPTLPKGGFPTTSIRFALSGGVYVKKSRSITSPCSGEISIPIFLSVGIFVKKLPFPALGSTTRSHSDHSWCEPTCARHFSATSGTV